MSSFIHSHKQHRLILLIIILFAFALRAFRLGDAAVWWDEGFSAWEARMGVIALADRTAYDVHPPFYYWLLHFWRLGVGDGAFQLRFLSVIFSVLTLVMLWTLARWLLPKRPGVALLAAFLFALSRYAVWWAQEIRMYALVGFLALLSLYAMLRVRDQFSWRWALTYVLATAAALLSLYTLAFLLVIEGLFWLWTLRSVSTWRRRAKLLGIWALLQMAVLALFLPWLGYALPRMWRWSVQEAFDVGLFGKLYIVMLHVGESTHIERVWPAAALAFLVVLAGVAALIFSRKDQREWDGLVLLILMLVVPPLAVWLLTTFPNAFGYSPRVQARYFYPFAATYYLLVAWAMVALADRLPRHRSLAAGVLLAGVAALSLWGLGGYYAGRYLQDEYQSVAQTLDAHLQPDDSVFLHTDKPWPVFAFYWPHEFSGWPNGQDADESGVDHWLAPVWAAHDGVWLVVNEDALRTDPQRLVEKWLRERAAGEHEWRFGPNRLLLFARTPQRAANLLALAEGWEPPPPQQPFAAPGVSVIGWEQPLVRVKAGDLAQVALTVDRDALDADTALSLALVRAGWQPWRENGGVSAGESVTEKEVIIPAGAGLVRLPITLSVPANAPAGQYAYILQGDESEAMMGRVTIFGGSQPKASVDLGQITPLASFGDPPFARLLTYELTGKPSPGDVLTLTLVWRVEATTDVSYKVFVHLIGPDGRPAVQGDDFPLAGARPTTSWQPGEILEDRYEIHLPDDMAPGDYPLRIGFYDPLTGERLSPVTDANGALLADDQVQLDVVRVGE